MTTYTLLVSIPDEEAPTCAQDLAEAVRTALEEGHGPLQGYTVATVDAIQGDRLAQSLPMRHMRNTHKHVAGENYQSPRYYLTRQEQTGKAPQ
ncbi:MAG: hypothetical protein ACRC1H_03985 [Caldilineaceae bacterium]